MCRRAIQLGIEECAIIAVHMGGKAYRASLRTGGKPQWLAEMFEAVVGAMFLEAGLPAVCAMLDSKFPLPVGLPSPAGLLLFQARCLIQYYPTL